MSKVLVFVHHKCATSFTLKYLAALASKNNLSFHATHRGSFDTQCINEHDVLHFGNAQYPNYTENPDAIGLHIIRNPLSVVCSAYFSHIESHPLVEDWEALVHQRSYLNSVSKSDGIWATIDFLARAEFYPTTYGPLLAMDTWNFDDPRFTTVRMEDFVNNPNPHIKQLHKELEMPDGKITFESLSGGRKVGQVMKGHHYRSGDPNDYKNHLSQAQIDYIRIRYKKVFDRFYD